MGIRLLGLTLSGIDHSGDGEQSAALSEPLVGEQPKLPFDLIEK
jgi:hypothetical protein